MEREVVQTDADRYVIVEYIAEGGMGAIFLGKKVGMEGFEKDVVLKQLLPEFTSQPEFIDLFLREAKLSASLDHANIVHTIDLVAAAQDYFIVMEYVRGGDLRSIQRRVKLRGHRIHPAAAIFIAREILSALAYAHEKKGADGRPLTLIHRDVSPSNIMVSGAGEVKLTDFGIAKVSTHKSVFYRVKGKVGYMSPEQAYGDRPLDHRSDLYSVAICLHEMLSGERLFVADLLSTPDQIYHQKIARLETLPDMPSGIDAVLARALARDPDDRYQSALDLQDALMKVAYDSGLIYTAPDLASHLRQVCGQDPAQWNREEEEEDGDHPGTEVLDGSSDPFSHVELTSVFTGLPPQLGPAPQTDHFAALPSRTTNHMGRNPRGLAYEPTRLANPVASVAFDVSDEANFESEPAYPPEQDPLMPVDPLAGYDYRDPSEAGLLAEMSGLSDEWSASDESHHPTIAVDAPNHVAMVTDLPDPVEYDAGSETPLPRRGSEALDQDATVELRVHDARGASEPPSSAAWSAPVGARGMGEPLWTAECSTPVGARTQSPLQSDPKRPDPDHPLKQSRQRRPEPAALTAQVDVEEQKGQRHRILLLVAAALLLLSGVAIVILVGLSGPDLDEPRTTRLASLPDLTVGMPLATPIDSGTTPDLANLGRRPDPSPSADTSPPAPPLGQETGATRALKVESTPPAARVFLDDVYQCRTPCTIEELEDDRIYLLSVKLPRYVGWSALVDMQGKRRMHISAYLSEEPDARTVGYLLLRSTPHADVFVDGKEIGRVTSQGRIPLPPGQYEISLHNPRRPRQLKRIVTIHARQTVALWLKF